MRELDLRTIIHKVIVYIERYNFSYQDISSLFERATIFENSPVYRWTNFPTIWMCKNISES
jgi:hypothetical protein